MGLRWFLYLAEVKKMAECELELGPLDSTKIVLWNTQTLLTTFGLFVWHSIGISYSVIL